MSLSMSQSGLSTNANYGQEATPDRKREMAERLERLEIVIESLDHELNMLLCRLDCVTLTEPPKIDNCKAPPNNSASAGTALGNELLSKERRLEDITRRIASYLARIAL